MKLSEYEECDFKSFTFEKDNEHRAKTIYVETYGYPNSIVETDVGISARYMNGVMITDSFIGLIDKHKDCKFMVASLDIENHPQRDEKIKESINNGHIFMNAYGNDNTGITPSAYNYLWITTLGVYKYNDKWKMRSYVVNDLSQVKLERTFAVDRSEEDEYLHSLSGTSFDRPYNTKVFKKIVTYAHRLGYQINQEELLKLVYELYSKINVNGLELYLITQDIEIEKVEEAIKKIKGSVKMNVPKKIIIHHSLTDDNVLLKDFDAIKRYHMDTKRFKNIGYHYVVEDNIGAQVYVGRDEAEEGAHTIGQNDKSIGVCVVGNYDKNELSDHIKYELIDLILDIRSRYGKIPIEPHNKYADKTCPGTKFPIEEIIKEVETMEKTWQEQELDIAVENGYINSPEYWLGKWEEDIKVKDVIGLVCAMFNRTTN